MALFTTTPASEIMPIMVMMMTKSIWKMTNPRSTPIKLKNTLNPMMNGVVMELNCATIIKTIKNSASRRARDKNANSLACSSC